MTNDNDIFERERILRAEREVEKAERERTRKEVVWRDRKRTLFGLPWSFTTYELTGERLVIDSGFWHRRHVVVRLYRIKDVTLDRRFSERIFGLGTISCNSSDATAKNFTIDRIKNSFEVAEVLYDLVETLRRDMKIGVRDHMANFDDIDDDDDDGFVLFDDM